MSTRDLSPIDVARSAWGAEIPDWVLALAEACARSSQGKVAAKLGRTSSMISQVLHNKYKPSLSNIEERVRGHYMDATVDCPGMGRIDTLTCQDWRERNKKPSLHNPQRVMMFKACRSCKLFNIGDEND